MKKKGFFFSTDALLALGIFVIAILLLLQLRPGNLPSQSETILANDILNALSTIKVNNSQSPTIQSLIISGDITPEQLEISIAELISELWSDENTSVAEQILEEIMAPISSKIKTSFSVNQQEIYSFEDTAGLKSIARGTRIVSGINRSQPTRGYSAYMQFSLPKNRTTSTFSYFGGFIGQGNITILIENLPADISPENVISFSSELSILDNVTIHVNGNYCGFFEATPIPKSSQYINLSNCTSFLIPGNNTLSTYFSTIDNAFIGGGFVQITYTTNHISTSPPGIKKHYLPNIEGIINIFDSITIPGNLTSMEIHLEYDAIIPANVTSNYFLSIGNTTVYNETNITSESITLTDIDLTMLNYSVISGTIPFRMGIEGINYSGYVILTNPSDTILVTDVSGSMNECGDSNPEPPLWCSYDCRYRFLFWNFETEKECSVPSEASCSGDVCGGSPTCISTFNHDTCRLRIDVAKEAAKTAATIILDTNITQIGTVAYGTEIESILELTNNLSLIESEIDSYVASGWTCTCCGINRAFDMYTNLSEDRSYMILMSDGDPNRACSGPGDYIGYSASGNVSAQSMIDAAEMACQNNVSVFTIAIGDDISEWGIDVLRQTACDDTMFFYSNDFSELENIYQTISEEILSRITYTSQIVNLGEGLSSNLSNSYISFEYEPYAQPLDINEIPITKKTPKFNDCQDTFIMNSNLRVIEASVTSYSDEHWTSLVGINNITIFNISRFGSNYIHIGDPFIIGLPSPLFVEGNNSIAILTASEPGNQTGCSLDNVMVISAAVTVIPPISNVASTADGCNWNVLQENSDIFEISIPSNYVGSKNCYYENSSYDLDDAYDISAYSLFSQLDIDNNGMIDIYLTEQILTVESIVIDDVPSLWGPALFEIKVGR